MRHLAWFSCGAASAVAAKLTVEAYGDNCEVVYCNTMATEHADNSRFFDDVERWIGKPIIVIESKKYATIDEVFERTHYMSGIKGARCTSEMKKLPREAFQRHGDIHIFGYTDDKKERKRAIEFEDRNPSLQVEWILQDQHVTRANCLQRLKDVGIALPVMYSLGFNNNNCLGCVKATSPRYWNRTRELFPEVFLDRCIQSRKLGVRLVRVDGQRIFLDQLQRYEDGPEEDIECGPVCQAPEEATAGKEGHRNE